MVRVRGGDVPVRAVVAGLVGIPTGLLLGAVAGGLGLGGSGRGALFGAVAGFMGAGIGAIFSNLACGIPAGIVAAVFFCAARVYNE
jgi:hypothetical protein